MTYVLLDLIFAAIGAVLYAVLRARCGDGVVWVVARRFALATAIASAGGALQATPMAPGDALASGLVLLFVGSLLMLIVHRIRGLLPSADHGEAASGRGSHMRGARLVSGRALAGRLKKEAGALTIGAQKIPTRLEPLHFLIAGATGTGKSVAISEVLDGISARGDRAFISDAAGGYLSRYYSEPRGDIVLNPLDSRAVSWSPLAEISSPWDAEQFAKSIIPTGTGSAHEWNTYAQAVVAVILKRAWENHLTNADIFRLAIIADLDELRLVFSGTPAAPLVAEGNERMFGSVRGIVGTYLAPYQYLDPAAGVDSFSLKKAVRDNKAGWMFFNFADDQLTMLAPIISAVTDIISKALLSMNPDENRKFWLILDEFASLGRVSSIIDFLTKARKFGGRAIIGIQTVAQLRSAYGQADAATLLSNTGSQLVLRVPDPETADIMSRMLGDEQVLRTMGSSGKSSGGMQMIGTNSENQSEQIVNERIIMPSQLQNLETLHGIINLAGGFPAAPVELEPRERSITAPAFTATTRKSPTVSIQKPAVDNIDLPLDLDTPQSE